MRRKANAPTTGETVNKRFQPRVKTLELRRMFGNMPPRHHWPDKGMPYDPAYSDAIHWLMLHPQAGQILFDAARSAKAIVYDRTRDQWVGRNWKPRALRRTEGGN